jgi:hypothetical protein
MTEREKELTTHTKDCPGCQQLAAMRNPGPQAPSYPAPDRARQDRLIALARTVRDNFSDVPVMGYNYLLTLAEVADERDRLNASYEAALFKLASIADKQL